MSLYKRKNSTVWWISFTNECGTRTRQSSGTTSKTEAQEIEARWKLEIRELKIHGKLPDRSFESVMLEFLKYSQLNKRSYQSDRWRTRKLKNEFENVVINNLTAAQIQKYIEKRQTDNVSNSTINREIVLFSAAINYCNKNLDWQLPNPCKGRRLPEPQGRVKWITEKQAADLIKSAKSITRAPHLADFIITSLSTGCRSGELLELTWERVDMQQNLILLEKTKSGLRRSVPLNKTARHAMLSRLNWRSSHCPSATHVFTTKQGNPIVSIKKSFKTACDQANIKDFRIHDMRHTFASWLVMRDIPLIVVRDLLGHASVKTTEIYAHLAPDNGRAGVAAIDSCM